MSGGKHTKGCCNPCGNYCIPNGSSPCAIESAQFYDLVALNPISPDDYCCFSFFFGGLETPGLFNEGPEGNCTWTVTDPGEHPDCDATLVISAGPEATLTMTVGAYTMVWKSVAGFNPLCTSLLTYRPELSTPPDDCGWPDQICLQPSEGCCPDHAYPDTLEVSTHVLGFGDCSCGDDTPTNNTLTRVPVYTPPASPYRYTDPSSTSVAARWIGIVDIGSCGHFLYVTMECIFDAGRYRMYLSYSDDDELGNCWPDDQFADEETSSCTPFIFHFTDDGMTAFNCCPGSFSLQFTIFEP